MDSTRHASCKESIGPMRGMPAYEKETMYATNGTASGSQSDHDGALFPHRRRRCRAFFGEKRFEAFMENLGNDFYLLPNSSGPY